MLLIQPNQRLVLSLDPSLSYFALCFELEITAYYMPL